VINTVAAVRALLLAELTATTVLGVPPGFGDNPPAVPPVCVLIQASGGNGGIRQAVIAPRLTLRCHGPTALEAWNVYRAVWNVFYDANGEAKPPRMITNRWWLRSATLSQPFSDTEPEGWPVTVATLEARFDPLRGATG